MMKYLLVGMILAWSMVTCQSAEPGRITYPAARQSDHVDQYFGTKVADPYRWMEENDTPELKQWIDAENKITSSVLSNIPFRDRIRREITERINYPKHSLPFKKNGRYFFFHNTGLQNQSVLYHTDSLSAKASVLLDPNTLSKDGTVSLANAAVSKNGKYLAWSITRSGSDWQEVFVTEIATGRLLDDHLHWVKFSGLAWEKDGFYYSRYDAPATGKELIAKNEFQKVYYHRLGTTQDKDVLVFEDKSNPKINCSADTDLDENWLFLYETESTYGNRLSFRALGKDKTTFRVFYPAFDAETSVVAVRDGIFYLLTDYKAPNKRLVRVDPARPLPEFWQDVIPESNVLLETVLASGNVFVARYLKDAASEVDFFDASGKKTGSLDVPGIGVVSLSGEQGDSELFYGFTSFLQAATVFRYDFTSGKSNEVFPSKLKFDPTQYTTQRLWYTSRDGTKAPMFVTHRKGIKLDGSHPTLLYGYGGFNINMTPMFKPERTVFLEHGGIFVVAVLRGGGEYGEKWHQLGTKLKKQNVFDDFIAAAEHLIRTGYTSNSKLAIQGGSNGGLLVGAVMTQRPDLFKVAVPAVGVLDMLRYHKFTIGWAWATDYGTSEENAEMFNYLRGYSPLHRIEKGKSYPATLVMTSDHDDRVVPAHSFKFAATLQNAQAGDNPVLIRIETKAGHGRGKPIAKVIEESADMYSFILYELGVKITP